MKKVVVIGLLFCWLAGRGQLLGGIFDQGATELKDNLQQIATLQTLIGVTEDGYGLTEDGLANIGGVTDSEMVLHTGYINRLSAVNPAVAGMPEVKEILRLDSAVLAGLAAGQVRWKGSKGLTAGEKALAGEVYAGVVQRVEEDVGALRDV